MMTMAVYDEARIMTTKDFKARFGSASYSTSNREVVEFREGRYKYWVNRIKQERGYR